MKKREKHATVRHSLKLIMITVAGMLPVNGIN